MRDSGFRTSELVALRRALATHPELAGQERRTSLAISGFLARYRPDSLVSRVGGCGLLAIYEGLADGPTVLIRCELDALPIPTAGLGPVSHRCGHDGHMAIVSALAPLLAASRPVRGRVVLVYQPAEETGEGAARVLADPRLLALRPDVAFALHNLPGFTLGEVVVRPGPFASASVGLEVELVGRSAHAGEPRKGLSPALPLAELISTFSSEPLAGVDAPGSLISVVGARLGHRSFGTLPGDATVQFTLRAYGDESLACLETAARARIDALVSGSGLELRFRNVEPFPAVHNDDEHTFHVWAAAQALGLPVRASLRPFAWSEDFGHFGRLCPSVLFGLGAGEATPALHESTYEFPDSLIPIGVGVFATLVDRLLGWPRAVAQVASMAGAAPK